MSLKMDKHTIFSKNNKSDVVASIVNFYNVASVFDDRLITIHTKIKYQHHNTIIKASYTIRIWLVHHDCYVG
jgi:hypothetical protein